MKKLSKKERERWIKAINKLINYYSQFPLDTTPSGLADGDRGCPFCVICSKILKIISPTLAKFCAPCPWMLFSGHTCMTKDSNGNIYSCYPAGERLKRLNLWKKHLEEGVII